MNIRIHLIFDCLLFFFFLTPLFVYAKDPCKILELELLEYKEKKSQAEEGLEKSKKGLMKAKEILLLARAKGDVIAGEAAEKAIKYYEESISLNNSIIKKCNEEIARIEYLLKFCRGGECNTIISKILKTRELLKRTVTDAESQSEKYKEFQKELETLMELQEELKSLDSRLEFVLNTLDITGDLSSVKLIKMLKKSIVLSSVLSSAQVVIDHIKLVKSLEEEAKKLAEAIVYAKKLENELKNNINLARKFFDAGLDISDLISKLLKTKNIYEKLKKLNDFLKVNEYIYKTIYINVEYYLLGEELSTRLYATDKTLEAIEALKNELKREMEIYKKCVELGKIPEGELSRIIKEMENR
ncbi:MAG: hypothetical protein ACK40E_03860 [Caldimicrobium sp.]